MGEFPLASVHEYCVSANNDLFVELGGQRVHIRLQLRERAVEEG